MSLKNYIAQEDYIIVSDSGEISPEVQRTIDSITTIYSTERSFSIKEEEEDDGWFRDILASSLILMIIGSIIFFTIYNRLYWGRGKFPPFIRFTRQKYFESTIYIALRFMLCNKHDYADNLQFLSGFLRTKFPDIRDSPTVTIRSALDSPVSVESTSFWLNKHLSLEDKQELFRFFGQIAISDGGLGRREYEYLTIILNKWGLDKSLLTDLEQEINRKRREEASKENHRTVRSTVHLKDKHLKTLGLESDATAEDIKKAYRKLVMVHHPDKYMGNNDFERETAKIKFIAIQEAYEYLNNLSQ